MILLDSDHLTALKFPETERYRRLRRRLDNAFGMVIGTTVVNVEELVRGWMAVLAKERQLRRPGGEPTCDIRFRARIASWGLRPGRKPCEQFRKSCS